jgi:dipeptidyl-peptidase-3
MFLEERTAVDAYFVGLRSLVMSLKKPRPVFVQANTSIQDGAVVLKQYPGNSEGMIQSFVERFSPFGSATLPPVQFAQ